MKQYIKKLLKKNKKIVNVAKNIQENIFLDTSVAEITPLCGRVPNVCSDETRLNLLIPSVNQEHIFGGISTAINIFVRIADNLQIKKRIVTVDAAPSDSDMEHFSSYKKKMASEEGFEDMQLIPFNDRYNKSIPVYKNDIFVATGWWTDYILKDLLRWQKNAYELEKLNKSIYIIQDYEPGFYQWSTRYMLAKSTYSPLNHKIGIFNTKLLYNYFKANGHSMTEEYFFEPSLNNGLKKYIETYGINNKREKLILLYGRPSVKRNCFELIVEALKKVVWLVPDISEWKIVSLGEKHSNINLGNDKILESYGKVSLEEYSKFMSRAYLGISLMASPHPSYPPMEMATFGMKVITNSYGNKDLSKDFVGIKSIDNIDIEKLSRNIVEQINLFAKEYDREINQSYFNQENQFSFIKKIRL